jgi:outer membrane protein assembly factor BamB
MRVRHPRMPISAMRGTLFDLSPDKAPHLARSGAVALFVTLLCAACGGASHHTAAAPHAHPLDGAEPAVAPALTRAPAGRVVSVGSAAEGIIAAPAAGVVAVAVRDPDRIALLSTRTGRVLREVPIAGPARHLALDGSRTLLVPAAPIDRLLELPLAGAGAHARRDTRSITTGALPHDAAALDGRVFVADEFGHAISVIEGDRSVARIGGFVQPGGIADVAGRVALIDVAADTVTLVDPASLRELGHANAGTGPTHDASGPDGRLYVTDTRGGALYTFATRPQLRMLGRLALPDRPYGIASDPADGRLFVTETGANRLVELDVSAPRPRIIATFPTVRQPNTVAVDPTTGEVYVAGADAGVVQELHP